MALTIKFYRLSSQSLLRNKGHLYNVARGSSSDIPLPWNYLWKPDEYKKEKHNEIAEKYHMHPKEYKPYPEHEEMGDYPDLPRIGPANKDPYYPYDLPVYKKNYHEIVYHEFGAITEDRSIEGYKYRYSTLTMALAFFGTMFGYWGLIWATDSIRFFLPMMEKQIPYTGKVHYTFEPAKREI